MVEIPALQNGQNIRRIMQTIRLADFVLILIDLTRDVGEQMENILQLFETYNIVLNRDKPKIDYKKTGSGGTQVIYNTARAKQSAVFEKNILHYASMIGRNMIVRVNDYVTPLDIKWAFNPTISYRKAFLVATKADCPNTKENFVQLILEYGCENDCVVGLEKEKLDLLIEKYGDKEQRKTADEKRIKEKETIATINAQAGKEEIQEQPREKSEPAESNTQDIVEDGNLDQIPQAGDYSIKQIDDYSFMGDLDQTVSFTEDDMKVEMEMEDERYIPEFRIFPCQITYDEQGREDRKGLSRFAQHILEGLKLIRIYTKSKNGVDDRPMIIPEGSTVKTIAFKIHKDLVATFRFAFIYREGESHKKKRVGLNYELKDNDILEIFA
jgi:ribosome-interacting GTPase 1